jgi:hypothetical protein
VPKPKLFNEWTRFTANLALSDKLVFLFEHADSVLLRRNVESNKYGWLLSRVVVWRTGGKRG